MIKDSISDALQFAARKHAGQVRVTDPDIPYISHPAAVGFILRDAGYPDDVVVAGILHDTVEDTDTTNGEIEEVFGKQVAELVQAVTEDKSLPWEERKKSYLQGVLQGPKDAKAISSADKINNISGILEHLYRGDKNVWKFFTREPKKVVGIYREFVTEVGKTWKSTLLLQLDEAVTELEKTL